MLLVITTEKIKTSEYGIQLRENQKARRIYGIGEGQFRKYFKEADRRKGVTGENLIVQLEQRFDNVVFRAGFADSRSQARQLVRHNHFRINGRKANIPSMLLKVGDVIQLKEGSKKSSIIKAIVDKLGQRNLPEWLNLDAENLAVKIVALPARENVDIPVSEQLIVELYSR
jgi:small subunit ribosomal protein S4